MTQTKALGAPCRVCGNQNAIMLPIGIYRRFFRLRVDTAQDPFLLYCYSPLLAATDASQWLMVRLLRRLWRIFVRRPTAPIPFRTFLTCCDDCHSITPSHEYSFEDLLGLYRDYRSADYNKARIAVEPAYAKIADFVGDDPREIAARNSAVELFLRRNAAHFNGGLALDYGGSDGRFITKFMYEKFRAIQIFDPSSAPLHPTVDAKIVSRTATPEPGAYDFIICMHVLEHVGNPRAFVAEAVRYLKPGGLLYIEIPLELTHEMHQDFAARSVSRPIWIHEHINSYDRMGVTKLAASLPGVEMVDSSEDLVDIGWISGSIGRFLIRKT